MSPSSASAAEWEAAAREHLTILIPSFRCGRYLPAAVASALHSPAGRILIADDGSGPEDLAVAEALAAANPGRIRLLRSPVNRGAAANLNEAAASVETAFFAKLDGDDVLIPGYLETTLPIIAARPRMAVLAGHELRIGADEAVAFRPERLPEARPGAPWKAMSGAEAYRFIVRWDPNPTSSGAIYRTGAFREVGGFDRRLTWGEDWEIWLRFARQWEVGYIEAPSALYRIHPESTTARTMRQNRLCYGYDAVIRRAAATCNYPEVRPLIRRRMLEVVKLYLAAAAREARHSRRDALECVRQALRALEAAFGPHSEWPATCAASGVERRSANG